MATPTDLIVEIDTGTIRGRSIDGAATFLGIPFAAPPVESLRFQAPQPVAKWAGIRDALDYGSTAPQPDRGLTLIPEPVSDGDDYLNLNVFTPGRKGDRLPVLVWIHGGGFFGGCNRSPWFRGHRFARDGIVFVSINYRLGAEGFMPMHGAPANRGVLDWVAGLEWVRRNIAAFGGDPSAVTIAGQSAGAMACAYLLTMPKATGLFHRVIAMSGSVGAGISVDRAEGIASEFRAALGILDDAKTIAQVPIDRFIAAQNEIISEGGAKRPPNVIAQRFGRGLPFQPVVDGDLIPQFATHAVKAGIGSDIPVLLSMTAEEFDFLAAGDGTPYSKEDLRYGLALLGLDAAGIAAYARLHEDLSPRKILGRAITDRMFRARAVFMAEDRSNSGAPTYLSEFRWKPQPPLPEDLGAAHCIDVPFAFDVLDAPQVQRMAGANPPQGVATQLHRAMAGFVKTADAGWPPYRRDRRMTMLFDADPHVEADPLRIERTFWAGSPWAET